MTALAALLERPLWELALGATSLVAACVFGALIFFWIGFRIAEVSALVGFEGMFSSQGPAAAGNARAIPAEVAARLQTIQDRRRSSEEKTSLDELALATGAPKRPPSSARVEPQGSKIGGIDRQL
ncbi:MAG: hypothetical protein O3A53_00545 [Acidobacteria bacterium]|nr:hypothetical protein [Acidobacteriota bacterium]MDA1233269.1 hypothetical protein [Acidobacteriota bacterium]